MAHEAKVVYGTVPVAIGWGTVKEMEAYAERMNKQAPQYNHRVVKL